MTPADPTPDGSAVSAPARRKARIAVGPRLRRLLGVVFALFALLSVNAVYLLAVRALEGVTGQTYQNWFYLVMFLLHLGLGVLFIVPVVVFGLIHMRNTRHRKNRRAVKVGYALFMVSLVVLATGIVLTRLEGVIVVKDPAVRSVAWWLHVLTPLLAAWLFVLHRLAGKKIQWRTGARWAVVAMVLGAVALVFQIQDPRRWNVEGPASGEQYFFPSLARTTSGDFIPERVLDNTEYCLECHADVHETWTSSAHRFSSFNNPVYLFSVRETRRVSLERDGNVQAARFCAGCHDPVVFFSGKFDDPEFDDELDPAGQAGVTCTACHAITHVNSPRGNSDFTIEEPLHYPFAFSEQGALRFINHQLVKSKPELHKKTFLKPLHRETEFCGTCHKVHIPVELNAYKWLRGQNHYDAFLLSGVSGHGITSFYYPEVAEKNCNDCHMPLIASEDFGAKRYEGSDELSVHDHLFPSANPAVPALLGAPPEITQRHQDFNEGVMRIDLFALREGGTIDGELLGPIRPELPVLSPGQAYLLETVLRTVKMGHMFTQGTTDSNQVWVDLTVRAGDRVIGRSGSMDTEGRVDPWSHFVNVYMLDREGNRIDRRNVQDIFVPLYNHQIPPGAADVLHFRLEVPPDIDGPITIDAALRYRKFDTTLMRYVFDDPTWVNNLPVLTLATDSVTLPVEGTNAAIDSPERGVPEWVRFNDYGIGLLRKGGKSKGQLRQAEEAFNEVERLGRPDGPLNLARVYLEQGTVQEKAVAALERAAAFDPPAPSWSVAWFGGLVDKQNGFLDQAIEKFESILAADNEETRRRGFDFSLDYRLLNELGQSLFERARLERGEARAQQRQELLERARATFARALEIDPENVTAHYNLSLIYQQLDQPERALEHRELHQKYKPDDNARDRAIAAARRRDPAADHAAEAVVIYDLQRPSVQLEGGTLPSGGGR